MCYHVIREYWWKLKKDSSNKIIGEKLIWEIIDFLRIEQESMLDLSIDICLSLFHSVVFPFYHKITVKRQRIFLCWLSYKQVDLIFLLPKWSVCLLVNLTQCSKKETKYDAISKKIWNLRRYEKWLCAIFAISSMFNWETLIFIQIDIVNLFGSC